MLAGRVLRLVQRTGKPPRAECLRTRQSAGLPLVHVVHGGRRRQACPWDSFAGEGSVRPFCAMQLGAQAAEEGHLSNASPTAAAPLSAEDVSREVVEITAGLYQLQQDASGSADAAQQLVARALTVARQGSLQDLQKLAACFADIGLRVPLRELATIVGVVARRCPPGRPSEEDVQSVVELLQIKGKSYIYVVELFEYCADRLEFLEGPHLATYVREAGRHGLRCRQFLGPAVTRAAQMVRELSIEDLAKCWQGFLRSDREWKAFYQAARPHIAGGLDKLTTADLLAVQRACRDFSQDVGFAELHASVCSRLEDRASSLELSEAASALMGTPFMESLRMPAHNLVWTIGNIWGKTEDLSRLSINEVVEALVTFASWGMRPLPLMDRLCDILVERRIDLKYAGNPSLWVSASAALARVEHVTSKWPVVAVEFARDRQLLDRISFMQQLAAVGALTRLQVYDAQAYETLADCIGREVRQFKDVTEAASVVWSLAMANCFPPVLFDAVYDMAVESLEAESLDISKPNVAAAWVQLCWAFTVAGYHQRHESFAAFLDYAFFNEVTTQSVRLAFLRRSAQLADLVASETPQLVALVQYQENLQASRADLKVHKLLSADAPAEPKLLGQIQEALQVLEWPHETCVMPDSSSSVYADISLAPKLGENVALLAVGREDLFADADDGSRHQSGRLSVVLRLLRSRGWKCSVISTFDWDVLESTDEKRALLEQRVASAK